MLSECDCVSTIKATIWHSNNDLSGCRTSLWLGFFPLHSWHVFLRGTVGILVNFLWFACESNDKLSWTISIFVRHRHNHCINHWTHSPVHTVFSHVVVRAWVHQFKHLWWKFAILILSSTIVTSQYFRGPLNDTYGRPRKPLNMSIPKDLCCKSVA